MKLSPRIALALAIVAGALEIIQQYAISATTTAHSVASVVLFILVGIGIVPLSGTAIGKLIPLHYAAVLTAAAGILQVVQQTSLGVSPAVHAIIAVVLLIAASLGIVPGLTVVNPVPVPAPIAPPPPPAATIPVTRKPAARTKPAKKATARSTSSKAAGSK